jgi:two-component system chemotaxis sensor kinase CheA
MNLDQALLIFIAESRELLEEMESALLALEHSGDNTERIHAIFRAAHTIKGSSGMFGLEHVVAFTHVVESVLDRVRAGSLETGDDLVATLLLCCDHMRALIDGVQAGQTAADAATTAAAAPLLASLHKLLGTAVDATGAAASLTQADAIPSTPDPGAEPGLWLLTLQFGDQVLRNGMDPLSFIRYLGTLGRIVHLQTDADALPEAEAMEPELCYLRYALTLETRADRASIERVFEFVRDEMELCIQPLQRAADADGGVALAVEVPCPEPLPEAVVLAPQLQPGLPEAPDAAPQAPRLAREAPAAESQSVRVDADKLDQLINLVGELIIAGASVNLIAHHAKVSALEEATSKLSMLVEEVRDSALQLRMVKIGATFNRFQRVVHDVSRALDKDIVLLIDGEDTELDKTVVEKIGDPLTHLVRNCMDHGIERAELRAARGKPAQGTLKLNAFHDSGAIVITVQDDGGGLNKDRILAKAMERGLVPAGQHLTDAEIYALVFEPGFSTAEQITNLSGRGVGLDVVKRNIAALRGSVSMTSTEGVGTTVTVRLPLTLAIIDGFLVEVGQRVFAIPLNMIEECLAYSAEPEHDFTSLRDHVLPFIRLREVFAIDGPPPAKGENIVVVQFAGQKAGLVVDTLLGEFQTVIKPLGPMFQQAACISGSTILGSGDVALILDVPQLVRRCISQQPRDATSTGHLVGLQATA